MKYLLLMLLGCCLFSTARAQDDEASIPDVLPFWNIASCDFHADKPRPLSIPGVGGKMEYYWYWTFKFRYRSNLEVLTEYLAEMHSRLEKEDALNDTKLLKANIVRLENTIKRIHKEAEDPSLDPKSKIIEKLRWKLAMYISLRTDTEQILPDLGSEVVRNLVERQEGKRFFTTREIQRLEKADVAESFDQDYGRGRWVNGIAVFSGLNPQSRQLEIRITGMGQRIIPTFVPGQLIYHQDMLSMQKALQPTMRRAVRFFYHKIGQSGEASLDTVKFERRSNEWLWVWPLQIYPGRYRELEITRDPEIEGVEPVKRRYIYLPYFIWNNTNEMQKFTVHHAGVVEDIVWSGENIRVVIYDDGGADARWKSQVAREIRKRQEEGEEKKFIDEYEMYPVRYDNVDIQKYYKENFKDLDYIPAVVGDDSDAQQQSEKTVEQLREELKKFSDKMQKQLKTEKDADLERKSSFTVADDHRLYSGTIVQGQVVNGVAIMQWGVTDIDALIDELISRLQMKALLGHPAEENDKLYAEYLKLRKSPTDTARPWVGKAEPARITIVEMLAKLAEKELGEKDIKITEDDIRRYGPAAPIGVLFNQLAWEKIQERANLGVTDIYFKVNTGDAIDSAYITAQFQRYLPIAREPLPPMADEFQKEGTKEAIKTGGKVSDAQSSDGAAEDKKEDTTEDDSGW